MAVFGIIMILSPAIDIFMKCGDDQELLTAWFRDLNMKKMMTIQGSIFGGLLVLAAAVGYVK